MTLHDLWLSRGGAFSTGVALLPQGAVTARIWARLRTLAATSEQPNDYELAKLQNALRKVEASAEATPNPPALALLAGFVPPPPPAESLPADLNRKHPLWPGVIGLMKMHSHVHAKMVEATDDATRGECAREIVQEIIPEIDRLCDLIRSGAEVEAAPIAAQKKPDALRQLLSLRSRVSKLPKLIASAKSPKEKQKYQQELDTKKAKILELENQDV